MAMGRPKAALVLAAELREELEGLANSRCLPAGWCVGQDYFVVRFWEDKFRDRGATGDQ